MKSWISGKEWSIGQKPSKHDGWTPEEQIEIEPQSSAQTAPNDESSRRRNLPHVLELYSEDLEKNHVPTDSGLSYALRFAAKVLRDYHQALRLVVDCQYDFERKIKDVPYIRDLMGE